MTTDAGGPGAPLRILVVLPSPPLRLLAVSALRAALASSGRPLVAAEADTAFEALVLLARERPALAVVALDLPVLSGDELVAMLRSRPEYRTLPVVVVAPDSDATGPLRAEAAGAAALLTCPFDAPGVAAALRMAGFPGSGT